MLIQNTNPMSVAPDQTKVREGFLRDDLFVAVHEQFMTETAALADIVLPATMFLEHDDLYLGGGHQHIGLGPKLVEPPGECRSNHEVVCSLAERVGADHRGFRMSPGALIDETLRLSGWGGLDDLEARTWIDAQQNFATAHYLDGFAWPDGRFRFSPDWPDVPYGNIGPQGPWRDMPKLPDHWNVIETADETFPFRLATSPARQFLNSSFTETPSSAALEGTPTVKLHPDDAARLGISDGATVILGNERGEVRLEARLFDGIRPGVLISEGIMPNRLFVDGKGINTLTGADSVAPFGGAAFHDTRVWMKAA